MLNEEEVKKLKKVRRQKIPKMVINYIRDNVNNKLKTEDTTNFLESITKSDKTMIQFVNFCHCLSRQSKSFKTATDIHFKAMKHNKQYNDFFKRATGDDMPFIKSIREQEYNILNITDELILN